MPETNLDDIRRGLQSNEFFLVYQPIVALESRRCAGAEALIRWRRGSATVIDAGDFIPKIENTPLSGVMTYWVMDTVAKELGEWLGHNPDAFVGINVPPEILGRGGIEYVADKSGLRDRAKQLVLEITERGVPDQLGLSALNGIPATGIRVALDDTTLSGANLALLTRCHFDFVKVGQTLVAQLDGDTKRPQWLTGLAALLGTTGLQVIAEGVERAQQPPCSRRPVCSSPRGISSPSRCSQASSSATTPATRRASRDRSLRVTRYALQDE